MVEMVSRFGFYRNLPDTAFLTGYAYVKVAGAIVGPVAVPAAEGDVETLAAA